MSWYLASSFSLQMLGVDAELDFRRVSLELVLANIAPDESERRYSRVGGYRYVSPPRRLVAQSFVGHEGTAKALSTALGVEVPVNRGSLTLQAGDVLYVAQPIGGRLTPGQEIAAPDLAFFLVHVKISTMEAARRLARRKAEDREEQGLCRHCGNPQQAAACVCGHTADYWHGEPTGAVCRCATCLAMSA